MADPGEAYRRSVDLVRQSTTVHGFVASPADQHYRAVWARDAAITCLGAHASRLPELMVGAARTIRTLARLQSPVGQIPCAYWPERGHWDWGEAGCVDASAWFVVAAADHVRTVGNRALAAEWWPAAAAALEWLRLRDTSNIGLIDVPPSTDWMDSSLTRAGKVFHLNVLHFWAARSLEQLAGIVGERSPLLSEEVRRRTNLLFWPEPGASYDRLLDHVPYPGDPAFPHRATVAALATAVREGRQHYLSHVTHAALIDRCDVLANLLAVLTGLAGPARGEMVLDFLAGVAEPYPSRSWPEPVEPASDPWAMYNPTVDAAVPARWRNPPWAYHNAGIWPYIGGFHVAALVAARRRPEAEALLEGLAAANRQGDWGFCEWLHGRTGAPEGARLQTWNAGTYLLAHHALHGREPDLSG